MYKPGTVLKLKEPREPSEKLDHHTQEPVHKKDARGKETKEVVMLNFPYNEVKVIGPSPIAYGDRGWQGEDARGVIIQPLTDFGGNLDEPIGKVKQLYDVVSIPEDVLPERTIKVVNATTSEAGETPEEVFAREAPGKPPKPGQVRARTPFEDVNPPKGTQGTSPL